MIVAYVLMWHDNDDHLVYGVYATESAAQKVLDAERLPGGHIQGHVLEGGAEE